jgi:hypothetical protein
MCATSARRVIEINRPPRALPDTNDRFSVAPSVHSASRIPEVTSCSSPVMPRASRSCRRGWDVPRSLPRAAGGRRPLHRLRMSQGRQRRYTLRKCCEPRAGCHVHFDVFYPFEYPRDWIYAGRPGPSLPAAGVSDLQRVRDHSSAPSWSNCIVSSSPGTPACLGTPEGIWLRRATPSEPRHRLRQRESRPGSRAL